MDFESYFMSVSTVTCLFTSYILSFLRHVLGGMKNLKKSLDITFINYGFITITGSIPLLVDY